MKLEQMLAGGNKIVLSGPYGTEIERRVKEDDRRIVINDDLGFGASALFTSEGRDYLIQIAQDYAISTTSSFVLMTPTFRMDYRHLVMAALSELVSSDLPRKGFECCRSAVELCHKVVQSRNGENAVTMSIGPSFDCYEGEKTPDGVGRDYLPQTLAGVRFFPQVDYLLFETVPSLKAAIGAAEAVTNAHKPFYVSGSRDVNHVEVINYFGPNWRDVLKNGLGKRALYNRTNQTFNPFEPTKPYVISFCLEEDATLNFKPLDDAVSEFLETVEKRGLILPLGFGLNCNSPEVTYEGLASLSSDNRRRFVSVHPNASSERNPRNYGDMRSIQAIPQEKFVKLVAGMSREFNIPIVGGCCGTDHSTLRELSRAVNSYV